MNLIITVRHDRDESCNDYTLTHSMLLGTFDANIIRESVRGMMKMWKDSYPYKGRTPHAPVVDVTVDGVTVAVPTDHPTEAPVEALPAWHNRA